MIRIATTRFRAPAASSTLHWDGAILHGAAATRQVTVTIPARLASFRCEDLPPASAVALQAAARLKSERVFAALGPVAVDGILTTGPGSSGVLLVAVPRNVISAIEAAAGARGNAVAAIRIAELAEPVQAGGLVEAHGEGCLLAIEAGRVRAVAALGPVADAGFAARLALARLSLGVDEGVPAQPAVGASIDVLHPTLFAPPPLLARRGVRIGLLAAGLAAVVMLAVGVAAVDAVSGRAEARAEAERLRPLAGVLTARRADLAEVGGWLDDRPRLAPGLQALASALPAAGSDEQVHLVRVRVVPGEDAVAEGVAGDRAQMMAFLERLRRDPRIGSAVIRASRAPAKDQRTVSFELVYRLSVGGARAAS